MPRQYFLSNECTKKLEIREERQAQWKHTSTTWIFFFLSRECSYEYKKTVPYIFFLCRVLVLILRVMNAKKNLEIREGITLIDQLQYVLLTSVFV